MQASVIAIWTSPLKTMGMRTFEADFCYLDRVTKREDYVWIRMQHLRENGSADLVPLSQVLQKSADPICRKKLGSAEKKTDLKSVVIDVVYDFGISRTIY